jgi:5-formyltetrahydrofolate cyclo-ligase
MLVGCRHHDADASTVKIPDDIKAWRKSQRDELLARRVAVSDMQRRAWNVSVTRLLVAALPTLRATVVGFCWPFKGEFDARFAMRHLRKSGAIAALPVVVRRNAALEFREWWPGVPTAKGVFDLPVPEGTATTLPQVLLMPPVGFDAQGYRLGYGGGYFDRTLAAMTPQPLKIGVAFELSRIATIHPQPYDVAMDFVVTEVGVHCVTDGTLERVVVVADAAERAAAIMAARATERPEAIAR